MSASLCWSECDILFSAHPSRPELHGRILSSSNTHDREPSSSVQFEFTLELPADVLSETALFDPPTCITVSGDNCHLFAFFPPSQLSLRGGVPCIWERADELTSWNVLEAWASERGNDVVSAKWLDNERKWSYGSDSDDSTTNPMLIHLPPRGPRTLNTPTLMAVMQLEEVQLHYQSPFRKAGPQLFYNHLRASLRTPSDVSERLTQVAPTSFYGALGQKVITAAAICPLYDESSVMIAFHSISAPASSGASMAGYSGFADFGADYMHMSDFDEGSQSLSIDVCEVQFDLHTAGERYLATSPLFSVPVGDITLLDTDSSSADQAGQRLSIRSLEGIPTLASKPASSSPSTSNSPPPTTHRGDGCNIIASISSSDLPQTFTHLETWSIARSISSPNSPSTSTTTLSPPRSTPPGQEVLSWAITPASKRTLLGPAILAPLCHPVLEPRLLLVMEEQTESGMEEEEVSRAPELCMRHIRLIDLEDDPHLPETPLTRRKSKQKLGAIQSIPIHVQPSPNQVSVVLQRSLLPPHSISLHPIFIPSTTSTEDTTEPPSPSDAPSKPSSTILRRLSTSLALHFLNRTDATDLVKTIWRLGITGEDLVSLINRALSLVVQARGEDENDSGNVKALRMTSVVGFLVGLYRAAPDESIRRRSQGMLRLCEIWAYMRAFDETLDDREDQLTLSIILQLITLASWMIAFCEDLVREILQYVASRKWETRPHKPYDGEGAQYTLLPIILMAQPVGVLKRQLHLVKQLQIVINRSESFVVASKQLASILESSPLSLDDLLGVVQNIEAQLKAVAPGDNEAFAVENFITYNPFTPSISPHLLKVASFALQHPSLRNADVKTRLLLPLSDILDIPIVVRAQTDVSFAEKDVVSKVPLTRAPTNIMGVMSVNTNTRYGVRVCVRCGSKAELRWLNRYSRVGMGPMLSISGNDAWNGFVNDWQRNCVCGGSWMIRSVA